MDDDYDVAGNDLEKLHFQNRAALITVATADDGDDDDDNVHDNDNSGDYLFNLMRKQ